jgi:hypothetical protein
METTKIKDSKKVLDKFLAFIQQFDKEDLQVVDSEIDFRFSDPELINEFHKLNSEKAKTYFFLKKHIKFHKRRFMPASF